MDCGAVTVTKCQNCSSSIRGYFMAFRGDHPYKTPSFCHTCGEPYPWTISRMKAAADLINEMESINDQEKKALIESVQEMTKDTPQSQVASVRYRKIIVKVGKETGDAMRDIIINIVSETIRRSLFGP
jgi:hypothetical protein